MRRGVRVWVWNSKVQMQDKIIHTQTVYRLPLASAEEHQPDKYESAPMTTRRIHSKEPMTGGLRERAETVDRKQDRTKTRTETKRNRSRKTTTQNETKTKPEKTRRDDPGEPGRN